MRERERREIKKNKRKEKKRRRRRTTDNRRIKLSYLEEKGTRKNKKQNKETKTVSGNFTL